MHFFQSGNLYTRPDAADFNAVVPYAQEVARNKARLDATFKVWLANGVTGVVDIGGPFWNFDMRDRANATEAAPRVAVAGPLISMIADPPLDLDDPPIIRIDTPEAGLDARQARTRAQPGLHQGLVHLRQGRRCRRPRGDRQGGGRRRACRRQEARGACDGTRRREGLAARRRRLPGALGVRRARRR